MQEKQYTPQMSTIKQPSEPSNISDDFMDWEERDTTKISLFKHCVCGSIAGIVEHLALYPVDTLKTHLQAMGSTKITSMRTAQILMHEEGILRFWKGANVAASGCIPAHASQFVLYEYLKEFVQFKNEKLAVSDTMFIGASCTFAHDFFQAPADVVKQRMQLCKNLKTSQCIRNIIREQGVFGLYRSYPLTLMMNAPFMSIVVCVNENLKTNIQPWQKENPYFWYFACAGISGGVAGILTNPLDVVKTRLQTQHLKPSCKKLRDMYRFNEAVDRQGALDCSQESSKYHSGQQGPSCNFEVKRVHYRNIYQTALAVYQQHGMSAFGRGIFPRMMINVPSTGLSWGTYELMKGVLGNNSQE